MADQIDGATFVERLKLVGEILSMAEDERARIRREAVDEFREKMISKLNVVPDKEFEGMSAPVYGKLIRSSVREVYAEMFDMSVSEGKDGD